MKKVWIVILILSFIFFLILCLPPAEVYLGINAPFVNIDSSHFNIFGYDIDGKSQLGVMLACGVLMMLPARLIPLAIAKIAEK